MRRMAADTTLCLHRRMLECERPGLVDMTIKTELVLCGRRTELSSQKTTVLIVAVAAFEQTLVDPMVKGPREVRRYLEMTAIAELRLRCLQKKWLNLRGMDGMTIDAANVVLLVLRFEKIAVLFTELVAVEAASTGIG